MLLELKRWVIPPGHQALLKDVSWSELEAILSDLGEQRSSRIAYSNGLLEIMTPLAEHEDIEPLPSNQR
jgi:Uma2 family endonuclease